mgnify:CR=1 FL=1
MGGILETAMLICFGCSWPINLVKNYKCRSAKGMSLPFILLLMVGYIAGISAKFILGVNVHNAYVLVVYLLVQCVLWQRRKGGFAALSGQLLGIWQLFLVLYLLLFGVVEAGLRFVPNLGMEMGVFDIMTVCMAFQWFLPVIFPGMPLIITGILLRERGLWWLGVGMAVLGGILSLGGILLTGYPQPASRQVLLSIGALGLLQYFFQPAALLLLARRLKRRPGGA